MTSTAYEDQFTDAPEPVHQPYDTGSILRRNVADLEIALRKQTERAESYAETLRSLASYVGAGGYNADTVDAGVFEEKIRWGIGQIQDRLAGAIERELVARTSLIEARNDIQTWIDSRNEWMARAEAAEAELAKLRAAPAVPDDIHELAYELGGTDSGEYHLEPESLDKIIAAVQVMAAVPAPAVPDGDDFNGTTPHLIQCMEALVRLDADGVLVPHGIGRDASKLLSAAANRLRKQPAPSVPEEWREFVKRTAEVGLHATNSGVECTCYRCVAIRGARALLQSPAVKESLTTQADCRALNNNRSKTT